MKLFRSLLILSKRPSEFVDRAAAAVEALCEYFRSRSPTYKSGAQRRVFSRYPPRRVMIGPLHSRKRCSAVSRRECLTSKQGCPRTHLSARSTKPTPSSPDFVIRLLESCADGCRCARAVDTSATQNVADEGGCLRRPFRIWSQEVHRGRIATRADYCE